MATVPIALTTPMQDLLDRLNHVRDWLNIYCIERKEEIDLQLLATIAAIDMLLLGDWGVGKTWQIELMVKHCIVHDDGTSLGHDLFTHLCAKDQSVGEILGERDVLALQQGRVARITAGMLPTAVFAYLDEIFKSSPPLLNPLLDIFAKRELKIGGSVLDCSQLVTIFMSSNELPDREDLMAFRDRIAITKFVEGVRSPEGRRKVTDMQLAYQANADNVDPAGLVPFTLSELAQMREYARRVIVPDPIRDIMGQIEQQAFEAHHPPSQRRKGDIWRAVKTRAFMRGSDTVSTDDFLVAEHMLWNLKSDADSAHEIVLRFANQFVRKAAAIEAELEPIMSEMDKIKQAIDAASTRDEKLQVQSGGFHFMHSLASIVEKTDDYIKQGQREGHDVTALLDARTKVEKARKWTIKELTGVSDDDDEDDDD